MVRRYSKMPMREGRETVFVETIGYANGSFREVSFCDINFFCFDLQTKFLEIWLAFFISITYFNA